MSELKYKVGDSVLIKSIDWYNKYKDEDGDVSCGEYDFVEGMKKFCSETLTISEDVDDGYLMLEDQYGYVWTDEMFECEVEKETKPKFKVGDKVILDPYPCVVTDVNWSDSLHGFVYTVRGTDFGKMVGEEDLVLDERTVPNTNEIIQLIKNDWNNFKDRYDIPDDYHFVDKNGNEINISEIVLEKKKKEYPKSYDECCEILGCIAGYVWGGYRGDLFKTFHMLYICREAYWKLYGEEIGLDKPWEPTDSDYITGRYCIFVHRGNIICDTPAQDCILTFPTEEMRDAFYENFKKEIEICKELL